MTGWLVLIALLVTLASLAYLLVSDNKRRRAHGLSAYEGKARRGLAWSVVLLPGAALLAAGQGAAFVIWLGATPMAGWLMTLLPAKTETT